MSARVDHLVIACPDPDAAAVELERRVGLRATGGGRHERLGTMNRLVWLGDTYLELIGVFDPELAAASWIGRPTLAALEAGGGLATWAVATDDVDGAVRRLRAAGMEVEGPQQGERVRADGQLVRWRLAITGRLGPGRPPFLIEHDAGAAEWTPAERLARADEVHPAGGRVRLEALELPVSDPATLAGEVAAVAGVTFDAQPDGTLQASIGEQHVVLRSGAGSPVLRLGVDGAGGRREALLGCVFDLRSGGEDGNALR